MNIKTPKNVGLYCSILFSFLVGPKVFIQKTTILINGGELYILYLICNMCMLVKNNIYM